MNLKKETMRIMKEHHKTPRDIIWVGCRDFQIPIDQFWKLADVEYNNSFGSPKVAQDLVVVGEDWYLQRNDYDGMDAHPNFYIATY